MGKTRVVHCKCEPYDVYIGRTQPGADDFGNPYFITAKYTREQSIEKFREYFYDRLAKDSAFKERVLKLKGLTLGCWCKPKACHGDVIVEYLESQAGIDTSKPVDWESRYKDL